MSVRTERGLREDCASARRSPHGARAVSEIPAARTHNAAPCACLALLRRVSTDIRAARTLAETLAASSVYRARRHRATMDRAPAPSVDRGDPVSIREDVHRNILISPFPEEFADQVDREVDQFL
eukprot:5300728-Pleurochrysis_carterae.AAC.1